MTSPKSTKKNRYCLMYSAFIHNIPKQLHDNLFLRKEVAIGKNFDTLQLVGCRKAHIHSARVFLINWEFRNER